LRFVQLGSGPRFAQPPQTELVASTCAVVGRLPLCLAKEERPGHHPESLLQIIVRS
jgi:hypothetical protein